MEFKISKSALQQFTIYSYLTLAMFPLMKENINSMFIILCVGLTILNGFLNNQKLKINKKIILTTLIFWLFLFHEIISLDLNIGRILLHLPFLIFPLLFYNRPVFINDEIIKKSFLIFQLSLIIQSVIYFYTFLSKNSPSQIFDVSPENIPFFRNYIFHNAFIEIHPTYFSLFLLLSFTISAFSLTFKRMNYQYALNVINLVLTIFLIFLFSSKSVILVLLGTIMSITLIRIRAFKRKRKGIIIIVVTTGIIIFSFLFQDIITKRFNEVKTDINKPVEGLYFNSTNIRVAILQCSLKLLKEVPSLGYGDSLQEKLNDCYEKSYKSSFYKRQTYNTHNYYLNIILYGGWVFFILFLVYIFNILLKIKYSMLALFIFIQIMIVNMTENVFSRHYGIIAFSYFISMFIFVESRMYSFKTK